MFRNVIFFLIDYKRSLDKKLKDTVDIYFQSDKFYFSFHLCFCRDISDSALLTLTY